MSRILFTIVFFECRNSLFKNELFSGVCVCERFFFLLSYRHAIVNTVYICKCDCTKHVQQCSYSHLLSIVFQHSIHYTIRIDCWIGYWANTFFFEQRREEEKKLYTFQFVQIDSTLLFCIFGIFAEPAIESAIVQNDDDSPLWVCECVCVCACICMRAIRRCEKSCLKWEKQTRREKKNPAHSNYIAYKFSLRVNFVNKKSWQSSSPSLSSSSQWRQQSMKLPIASEKKIKHQSIGSLSFFGTFFLLISFFILSRYCIRITS